MHRYVPFRPGRVFVEADARGSDLARRLEERFPVLHVDRYVPVRFPAPEGEARGARALKSDLVVRRMPRVVLERFGSDQDVSFDLAWGCPLNCSYCTLLHRLPRHPYIAVYSNLDEILEGVDAFIATAVDPVLIVGDTTDCLALEPLTGSLRRVIEHFGRRHAGRARPSGATPEQCPAGGAGRPLRASGARLEFLTKSGEVGSILDADHRGATSVGFSLNTPRVVAAVEHGTAPLEQRLEGLRQAMEAGYGLFLDVAPMFCYPGWQEEYRWLLREVHRVLAASPSYAPERLRFEAEVHWQKESEVPLSRRLYPRTNQALLTGGKQEFRFAEGSLFRYPDPVHQEMGDLFLSEVQSLFPGAASARFCPPADPADQGTLLEAGGR